MKNRKTFAMICYFVCIAACIGAGVVSFLAYKHSITYTLGFLIWIGAYWFLGFFNALAREKNGKKTRFIVKKSLTRGLSAVANIMSVLLLCFWVYAYIFMVLPANKADGKAKVCAQQAVSSSVVRD